MGRIREEDRIKRPWDPDRHHHAFPAFWLQRANAKRRKIPWRLTFKQWWDIWHKSEHWHERGRKSNQYCMGRIGDRGAYEVSNIIIITNHENHLTCKPHRHTEAHKKSLRKRKDPITGRFTRCR